MTKQQMERRGGGRGRGASKGVGEARGERRMRYERDERGEDKGGNEVGGCGGWGRLKMGWWDKNTQALRRHTQAYSY